MSTQIEFLTSIEYFDPVSETWSLLESGDPVPTTDLLSIEHFEGMSVMLADGTIMIGGGGEGLPTTRVDFIGSASVSFSAPTILSAPGNAAPESLHVLTGKDLNGLAEASGGPFAGGSRIPQALWVPVEGAPELGAFSAWSDTSADWVVPAPRYPGPGLLFAVTNGVRSKGVSVTLSPANSGQACISNSQCSTGFCVDNVCCESACAGVCVACSAAKKGYGKDGVCEPVAASDFAEGEFNDPDDECTTLNECPEFTGACSGELLSTSPVQSTCAVCPAPTSCDGDNSLVMGDEVVEDCAPYRCSTETDQCLIACKSNTDCVSGSVCTAGGVCTSPPELGESTGCSMVGRGSERPSWPAWFIAVGATLMLRRRRATNKPRSGSSKEPRTEPAAVWPPM